MARMTCTLATLLSVCGGIAWPGSAAAGAREPVPSAAELATALTRQTRKPVPAADVRPLDCEGFAEEPTEFACRWRQRVNGRWLRYSTYFAIDGNGWTIIDWPPSRLK